MVDYLKRSWAVVDLDAIAHNVHIIRDTLPSRTLFMGVVKADAYGHGDRYVARELEGIGVDWLGVAAISEAVSLRRSGITKPILIFGSTPVDRVSELDRYSLTQTVYSPEYAKALSDAARDRRLVINIHVKVDTGMGRLGFFAFEDPGRAAEEIQTACGLPGLKCSGIYSHFSCADEAKPDSEAYTRRQYERFHLVADLLERGGTGSLLRHICNSAGTLRFSEYAMDMVRVGIALYGLNPGPDCGGILDLRPAMSLYSTVTMVKEVRPGLSVSYGRRFTTGHMSRLATVPIGYADGYDRTLSNRGRMLVRGRYAPVAGTVCMDQLVLDVTHIPQVREGDTAVIIGRDGEEALTLDEMAALTGTISYEKACLIGRRVPRVYRKGGAEAAVVDYVSSQPPDNISGSI